ncbi:hypothetical protein ACFX14_006327 [Malus domestica]
MYYPNGENGQANKGNEEKGRNGDRHSFVTRGHYLLGSLKWDGRFCRHRFSRGGTDLPSWGASLGEIIIWGVEN